MHVSELQKEELEKKFTIIEMKKRKKDKLPDLSSIQKQNIANNLFNNISNNKEMTLRRRNYYLNIINSLRPATSELKKIYVQKGYTEQEANCVVQYKNYTHLDEVKLTKKQYKNLKNLCMKIKVTG